MRRPLAVVVAALAVGTAACGGGTSGASSSSKAVDVTKAWARTTPPGVSVGAVYLTASSAADDALTGASIDAAVAAKAELHTESTSGGMTSMAPVASVPVTKQKPLVLGPLGSHLMLLGLAGPLTKGETFDVTLHFAKAGDERVRVEVRDAAP